MERKRRSSFTHCRWYGTASIILTALVWLAGPHQALGQTAIEPDAADTSTFDEAVDAYIYGYPLVMLGITERVGITVPSAGAKLAAAPLNQFGKEPSLPTSAFKDVVLPSTTTLYASAFINLKAEPLILHIPDMKNRFYLLQMLDGWTNVSDQSPGSRLGSKEGYYALVGPHWKGDLPYDVPQKNVIRMDTYSMWIIGRIYTSGTDEDISYINDVIYPELTLTPLSKFHKDYDPPSDLPLDPSIDVKTPPLHQVAGMDACAFFGTFSSMMIYNRPLPADHPFVRELRDIGIDPGSNFDCTTLRPRQLKKLATLQLAVAAARLRVQAPQKPPGGSTNYWVMPLDVGSYGTNYLLRAQVAYNAFGANNAKDAVYGYGIFDGRGLPVNGSNAYQIHFNRKTSAQSAEEIPPVNPNAFWSVTIYNEDGTLVANDSVKYNAIGIPEVQNHSVCFNPDKSIDLYLQADQPSGSIASCNWLPIPDGKKFIVFLRMYWPDQAILDGKWVPPPIQRIR